MIYNGKINCLFLRGLFVFFISASLINSTLNSVEFCRKTFGYFRKIFKHDCSKNLRDNGTMSFGCIDPDAFEIFDKCPFCTHTVKNGIRKNGHVYHSRCINQLKKVSDYDNMIK